MYKINVQIKGIAPLLINGFTDDKPGKKSVDEYRAIALAKLHRDEKGQCCVTAEMVKSCAINGIGMAGIKFGRKSFTQFFKATVFIEPRNIPINTGIKEPDFIDNRMGRIPPGPRGSAVMIYRPGFNQGWTVNFTLVVQDDKTTNDMIKGAFEGAGLLSGLGAGRPDFGRFQITKWEVSNARSK